MTRGSYPAADATRERQEVLSLCKVTLKIISCRYSSAAPPGAVFFCKSATWPFVQYRTLSFSERQRLVSNRLNSLTFAVNSRGSVRQIRDKREVTMTKQVKNSTPEEQQADLLYGVPAIAGYLGLTQHQARHNIDKGRIPTFRMGVIICARKSSLVSWFEDQERGGGTGLEERIERRKARSTIGATGGGMPDDKYTGAFCAANRTLNRDCHVRSSTA